MNEEKFTELEQRFQSFKNDESKWYKFRKEQTRCIFCV